MINQHIDFMLYIHKFILKSEFNVSFILNTDIYSQSINRKYLRIRHIQNNCDIIA